MRSTGTLLLLMISFFTPVIGNQYVVYPIDRDNGKLCDATTVLIQEYLGKSSVQTFSSKIRMTTDFWFVEAMPSQKSRLAAMLGVSAVVDNTNVDQHCGPVSLNKSLINDPNFTATTVARAGLNGILQTDAPQDLDLISWPPGRKLPPFWGNMEGYAYNPLEGVDTYIYIIDWGINPQHTEFTSKPYAYRDVEWHYGPNVRQTKSDDDPQKHGSCVASKAAGWKTGVSKNSRLVVMKSSHSLQDITFAFFTAFEDIMAKSRQKKAVVVYPRTSLRTFVDDSHLPPEWDFLSTIISDMRYPGIIVVTSAGNNAARSKNLDTFPAILTLSRIHTPILVAGATTIRGDLASFSQGQGQVRSDILWAPGDDIVCADGSTDAGLKKTSGTSFSAPMVAGQAAIELKMGSSVRDPVPQVLGYLLRDSRAIYPLEYPKIIWNRYQYNAIENASGEVGVSFFNDTTLLIAHNNSESRAAALDLISDS